jgi:hypothetical protein
MKKKKNQGHVVSLVDAGLLVYKWIIKDSIYIPPNDVKYKTSQTTTNFINDKTTSNYIMRIDSISVARFINLGIMHSLLLSECDLIRSPKKNSIHKI